METDPRPTARPFSTWLRQQELIPWISSEHPAMFDLIMDVKVDCRWPLNADFATCKAHIAKYREKYPTESRNALTTAHALHTAGFKPAPPKWIATHLDCDRTRTHRWI